MKSYTDIEQSRTLSEFLPYESADQTWVRIAIAGANFDIPDEMQYRHDGMPFKIYSGIGLPCWSLAALLDYLSANFYVDIKYLNNYWELDCRVQVVYAENLVDACADMMIKLHDKKLL